MSWTNLDELASIVRRVCSAQDFTFADDNSVEGENRKITRRFIAESKQPPVVEVEVDDPVGFYFVQPIPRARHTKELPKVRVFIRICDDKERPVEISRARLSEYSALWNVGFTQAENEEYTRRQDVFATALLDAVDEWRKGHADRTAPTSPEQTATSAGQAETMPREKSKRKDIFGLRIEYLLAGIVLGILISIGSLFVFPEWARSNILLVILFPFAFAAATNFIANFRKAYE